MWKFDGYSLRLTQPQDEETARRWMAEDREHDGRFPPSFWLERNPSTDGMILEDEDGQPVLFLRIERIARVHVQFPPMQSAHDRARVMKAVDAGFQWLIPRLGVLGFCGMVFASRVDKLKNYFISRYGFRDTSEWLYKPIPVYTPPNYKHMGAPLGEGEKVN